MADDYLAARDRAKQYFNSASHLLKVTFPVVKDPKLLLGVIHHLHLSMEQCLEAILSHDQQLQLVPKSLDTFQAKIAAFRHKSCRRHNIPIELLNALVSLKEIVDLQQRSTMQFPRGPRFVLSTSDYRFKAISVADVQKYSQQAEQLIAVTDQVLSRYFNRK